MEINEKILNINEIIEYIKEQKNSGQKVVLCQGHFNTVHPGHIRFLEYAKKQGDCLIVAIQGYNHLEEKNKKNFFDEYDRARGVASLQKVDKVIIFNDISFLPLVILSFSGSPTIFPLSKSHFFWINGSFVNPCCESVHSIST